MTNDMNEFLKTRRDVEIQIVDGTLPLADVQPFVSSYVVSAIGDVRIVSRWSGPAAGGPGWGGPEIAVAIVVGEMLRRVASDAYTLVRGLAVDIYNKINTRTAARYYIEGALAIGLDSEASALRVYFCIPEGLTLDQLNHRLDMIERYSAETLRFFEQQPGTAALEIDGRMEVNVCWDEQSSKWHECHPKPEGEDQ
jgi:hypothetical protein